MSWDDYFANEADPTSRRTITVGWTVRAQKAHAIWGAPEPFNPTKTRPASAKSVQYCPAAVDFDRRHFVVPCPIDLTLRCERGPNGQIQLVDGDGPKSGMRPTGIREMVVLHPPAEWKQADRPVIQIIAPYVFVADDPCFLVQSPPYLDYFPTPRPGLQIGGRLPIHIWPRPLSWGFEWHDVTKPLVLKRGEPWFYVHFETTNPAGRVRLVEQEMTPELTTHIDSILDVSNYVNKTFSLFNEAQARRPASLVQPKKKP